MDALIKTVLDYASYLRERDVDRLTLSGSVWRGLGTKGKSKK
jgi:hypothetical protein